MMHRAGLALFGLLTLSLAQCKTPDSGAEATSSIKAAGSVASIVGKPTNVDDLPVMGDVDPAANAVIIAKSLKNLSDEDRQRYAERIGRYLAFLGLDASTAPGKKVLSRLLTSSTQFILCDDFNDWACLEEKPWVTPRQVFRQDTADDLGAPVVVNEPFKLEFYFTNQFDVEKDQVDMSKMLALRLADKIKTEGKKSISMAIYGIDDIKGSMKPVYDAIVGRVQAGADVRAVVDTGGISKQAPDKPLVLSFKKPTGAQPWTFDEVQLPKSVNTNLNMQYKDSVELMEVLNKNSSNEDDYKARIEWPNGAIMHNKFLVFDRGNGRSVWTGTSNVTETCMGTERNSNLGLFINNDAIADAYQTEFEEMYQYQDEPVQDDKLLNAKGKKGLKLGRFHGDKRPNTHRYFRFKDGTETRVHFAPTDDGEHRSILPMLLSAQPGDQIRISMFGMAGIELVRAIQYAEAHGAQVSLVLDCTTGTGILRGAGGNLLDPNPYAKNPKGQILIRRSTWKKLNHHKSASLSRATNDGEKAVMAIVGSQNWSAAGNDSNDENMVSIRSLKGELELAKAFNDHFDTRLWEAAKDGEMQPNVPYKEQGGCHSDGDSSEEGDAEAE